MAETAATNLRLIIANSAAVASGVGSDYLFTPRGGSIGTAPSDSWQLSGHRTGAMAGHAEIRFIDGGYCLIDRSGRTYINSASQPVGRGRRARLTSGDVISIGRYQLKAELVTGPAIEMPALDASAGMGESLVDGPEGALRRPLSANESGGEFGGAGREPLSGLPTAPAQTVSDDPLAGLTRGDEPASAGSPEGGTMLAHQASWFADASPVTDEYRDNRDVALGLPVTPQQLNRNDRMSEPTPGHEPTTTDSPADASRQHISGAPLLKGMAAELSFADSDEMRLFLEEAGATLKATINGLLSLHQQEDRRHRALRTRLQPIEDNPLRLPLDYSGTIQTLFAGERSPVHLSAPAAVAESLEGLRQHQQATQAAIAEALEAILHAFSPAALLRRFHGYRRGLQADENEAEWAWQMYQHYYRELSSSRQQGFERLFQEVFDQAYDQHLRQLQRENLS